MLSIRLHGGITDPARVRRHRTHVGRKRVIFLRVLPLIVDPPFLSCFVELRVRDEEIDLIDESTSYDREGIDVMSQADESIASGSTINMGKPMKGYCKHKANKCIEGNCKHVRNNDNTHTCVSCVLRRVVVFALLPSHIVSLVMFVCVCVCVVGLLSNSCSRVSNVVECTRQHLCRAESLQGGT